MSMERCCWFCQNSVPATAMDQTEVLVCYNCAGYEGREMQVDEDETCDNFKSDRDTH